MAQWFKHPSGNPEDAGSNPGSRPRGTSAGSSWVKDTSSCSGAGSQVPWLASLSTVALAPGESFRAPMPMPMPTVRANYPRVGPAHADARTVSKLRSALGTLSTQVSPKRTPNKQFYKYLNLNYKQARSKWPSGSPIRLVVQGMRVQIPVVGPGGPPRRQMCGIPHPALEQALSAVPSGAGVFHRHRQGNSEAPPQGGERP